MMVRWQVSFFSGKLSFVFTPGESPPRRCPPRDHLLVMILLKFNWASKTVLPDGGRFNFGDTYKVAEMVLNKGKATKACTMEGKVLGVGEVRGGASSSPSSITIKRAWHGTGKEWLPTYTFIHPRSNRRRGP